MGPICVVVQGLFRGYNGACKCLIVHTNGRILICFIYFNSFIEIKNKNEVGIFQIIWTQINIVWEQRKLAMVKPPRILNILIKQCAKLRQFQMENKINIRKWGVVKWGHSTWNHVSKSMKMFQK